MIQIDKQTYNKTKLGYGYGRKRLPQKIQSLLIHTTNGKKGTVFENECQFIYQSRDISAHYLCGRIKDRVVEFLAPEYIAWHAGDVIDGRFSNPYSIGIENHCTVGESWPTALHSNLTELCVLLLQQYPSVYLIGTHRHVAPTRKIDPSGFPDDQFYTWSRTLLLLAGRRNQQVYVTKGRGVHVYQGPDIMYPIAGELPDGEQFISVAAKVDSVGQLWVHVSSGAYKNLGFVRIEDLRFV